MLNVSKEYYEMIIYKTRLYVGMQRRFSSPPVVLISMGLLQVGSFLRMISPLGDLQYSHCFCAMDLCEERASRDNHRLGQSAIASTRLTSTNRSQVVHQIESYRILREGRALILLTRPL